MDEIQVPLPTQSRCPESPRLQHLWLMCKTNKIILHTKHYFKELVTVKVAVDLIMIVKRTQITWNGPFDNEDEHVSLSGQFRGDGRTVRTLVFGVYKICCITGSYLWVIQKDITLKFVHIL